MGKDIIFRDFCDYCGRRLDHLERQRNSRQHPFVFVGNPIFGRQVQHMKDDKEYFMPRYVTVKIEAYGHNKEDMICDSCCHLAVMHECMRMLDDITRASERMKS